MQLLINLREEQKNQVSDKKDNYHEYNQIIEEKQRNSKKLSLEKVQITAKKIKLEEAIKAVEENLRNTELSYQNTKYKIENEKNQLKEIETKRENHIEELKLQIGKEIDNTILKEIKEAYITEDKIKSMEETINSYNINLEILKNAVSELKSKIEKEISFEEFQKIKTEKEFLEQNIKKIEGQIIIKEKNLEDTIIRQRQYKEKSEELKKEQQLNEKLVKIRKLLDGKKFVSYIAKKRLDIIARNASNRLMEISNNNYSLSVDEDSNFAVIDYKNNGVEREISSLSGGEIFITSLALSLALAQNIQLKGANLELFFLDEGFGTLDENLLDVVMESIEKIKNDRLSIGLISHVESIKQRVPRKLIVQPAEYGGIGSKVYME